LFNTDQSRDSIIEKTYCSENLPPAFAEAASRRQVAPVYQRGVIAPFVMGGKEGFSFWCPHNYGIKWIEGKLVQKEKTVEMR
jgi:hypothetical protein